MRLRKLLLEGEREGSERVTWICIHDFFAAVAGMDVVWLGECSGRERILDMRTH